MAVAVAVAFGVAGPFLLIPVGCRLCMTGIEVLLCAGELLVTQAGRVIGWHVMLLYGNSSLVRTVEVQLALQLLFLGCSSLFLVFPMRLFNF